MAIEQYSNAASSTLDGAITDVATAITVVDGSLFPSIGDFRVRVDGEIMLATARTGNNLTVTRGIESTANVSHSGGAAIDHILTAEGLQQLAEVNVRTGTVSARPSAGRVGRLYFPTNGLYVYRDTGSAWEAWHNGKKVDEPVDGDFAWINQGGASVSTINGGIYLSAPASGSNNLRIRKKAAPSTPYTITAQVIPSYSVSHADMGVLFRQSSDGKLHTFRFSTALGIAAPAVRSRKFTNPTTTASDYNLVTGAVDIPIFISTPFWMRIADDGANRILSYSADGYNFVTVLTIGRTDFLTADEVGFFANATNASLACGITLLSWTEN
jgi:hypothetical protein